MGKHREQAIKDVAKALKRAIGGCAVTFIKTRMALDDPERPMSGLAYSVAQREAVLEKDELLAQMAEALEETGEILGQHNPQASWLLEYEICPKDHPDCCGFCEILHQRDTALAAYRSQLPRKEQAQ